MAASMGKVVEEILIVSGLVAIQMLLAANIVFINRVLVLGLDPLFLVAAANLAAAPLLLPFACLFEKDKWRMMKLCPLLIFQILLISIMGVPGFQGLILLGNKKTSPAIASALPNLAPGIIFAIAACLRYEKFSVWCKYSRAKILGTTVCLFGATTMSFLMSPAMESALTGPSRAVSKRLEVAVSREWMFGCLCLLTAIVFLSCTLVLQVAVMMKFPAPFSLCTITCLVGSISTAALQYVVEGRIDAGSSSFSTIDIIAIVLLGAAVNGVVSAFTTWCVTKKGPVMVSIFSPIGTVSSALISALILHQVIGFWSLAGMLVMFVGLYIVLWAKKKEDYEQQEQVDEIGKPLLA